MIHKYANTILQTLDDIFAAGKFNYSIITVSLVSTRRLFLFDINVIAL